MTFTDHAEYAVRCEWGVQGIERLAPTSDVVIVADVLSFSTCVEIATARGAIVYPYQWNDGSAADFAAARGAMVAAPRVQGGFSLSPASLLHIEQGTKLVLPSPNGSEISLRGGKTLTFAGSLRNCRAIAAAANRRGATVALIPAGERWPNGSLRPAIEYLIGAGAIISYLNGTRSPEAEAAVAAFERARPKLAETLVACSSGKELVDRGFSHDVELSAQLDVSDSVPVFKDEAYSNHAST